MGKSGIAAIELLLAKGAKVRAVDQRPLDQLGPTGHRLTELGVDLLPQAAESFQDADMVVLSPGVPVDLAELLPLAETDAAVIGEVELASAFLKGPVIGITGANGKTTTTAMIGHILKENNVPAQVGGNIGTPPTSMVGNSRNDQWNVLELSSFQLETIYNFRAKIAVCLNVTPDHLDRHHTFERYAAAKGRLFETQTEEDFAVLNADDQTCVSYIGKTKASGFWFSSTGPVIPGAWVKDGIIHVNNEKLMPAGDIPLAGAHNVENTMAAAVATHLAGLSLPEIASAVRTFPGVEHRLEFVRELNGVKYYNDSKATNVDATEKAIDSFPGGLWIILGGKDKNSDYTVLRDKLKAKAKGVLLVGAAAEKIEGQLKSGLPLQHCGTIEAAVEKARREATSGDIVLLAPACASFDQFQSYEHRGRVFKDVVNKL